MSQSRHGRGAEVLGHGRVGYVSDACRYVSDTCRIRCNPRTSLLLRRQIWPAAYGNIYYVNDWIYLEIYVDLYRGINRVVRYI